MFSIKMIKPHRRYFLYRLITIFAVAVLVWLVAVFLLPFGAAMSPLLKTTESSVPLNGKVIFKTAVFTVFVAGTSTAIALITGLPAAFFCARRNFFGKNFLLSLSAIPLCMPPLLIALGFVLVFGMQGSVNRFIMQLFRTNEPSLRFLYSFWGIVIAQGFYNFPIVMKSCYDAWKTIPPEQAHAAKLLGASNRRVFFTVTLYQLTPALVSSCILVCLYCFFSFLIVLLFGAIGSTTLEVAIYQAVRSSFDFKQAAILALIETSIALCLVFAWSKSEKAEKKNVGITYGRADNMPTPLQKNERPLFFIFMSIVFLFFLLPIFSVAAQAFSGNNFYTLFSRNNFWQAFFNTVQTAFLTATLSVIAALVVAVFIRTYDPNKKNIGSRVLPLLPMSVSSVVMGFGMTVLVSRGTPLALVFAQAALTWPLAFKQISATMDRIPQENLEAAQLLSSDSLEGIFRVQIPLCRHSIASAFGFCFAVSSADAVLPLVLAIPRYETLALFTYRLAGSYRFGEACAAGTVLLALSSILFYGRKKI